MVARKKSAPQIPPASRRIPLFVALAFLLSGAACLLLEVVWARSLTLVFGGTVASVSTVIAAFMAGLGLGSIFFGRMADRIERRERLFVFLVLGAAVAAPIVHYALPVARAAYGAVLTEDPSAGLLAGIIRFLLAFVMLVVPAALMGGTLPVLSRILVSGTTMGERIIGRLYSINTLGGAAGCFVASMCLIGTIGLQGTVWIASTAQLTAALLSWLAFRKSPGVEHHRDLKKPEAGSKEAQSGSLNRPALLALLALLTGFAALSYEVLWTRVLMMYLRNSPHTFALILSVYLIGIALGSALYSAFFSRHGSPLRLFGWIQVVLGVLALGLTPCFGLLPDLLIQLRGIAELPLQRMLYPALLLSGAVVLVPAVLMGLSLPILFGMAAVTGRRVGGGIGRLYFANTLGAILGSLAAGFLLIPFLGTHSGNAVTVLLSLGAAALAFLAVKPATVRVRAPVWICAGLVLATLCIALFPGYFRKVLPPSFGRNPNTTDRILYQKESVEGSVTVIEDVRTGVKSAYINNSRVCGSAYDAIKTVHLLGALPVLCHRSPEDALIIGLGLGITTSVVASWDGIEVDCVEICPAVTGVLPYYESLNHGVLSKENVRLFAGDGRNFVAFCRKRYDLISCDPTHPAMGSGTLYALEHYQACRDRLREGGITAQYLPLHKMDRADFRTTLATFTEVFPDCALFLGVSHGVMVGSRGPLRFDLSRIEQGLASCGQIEDLRRSALGDPVQILGYYLAGGTELRAFAVHGAAGASPVTPTTLRLNTDDLPLLDYAGSRGMVRDTWSENMSDLLRLPESLPSLTGSLNGLSGQESEEIIRQSIALKRHLLKGQWYTKQGDGRSARESYRKAAEINPRDPEVQQVFR